MNTEETSNCCGASVEEHNGNTSRCNDCKEHCGVVTTIFPEYIESTYQLGTVNGYDWTVYPQV